MNARTIKNGILFWIFTAICGLYLIPAMVLAYVNPLWFRWGFQKFLSHQIDQLSRYRLNKFGKKPVWV